LFFSLRYRKTELDRIDRRTDSCRELQIEIRFMHTAGAAMLADPMVEQQRIEPKSRTDPAWDAGQPNSQRQAKGRVQKQRDIETTAVQEIPQAPQTAHSLVFVLDRISKIDRYGDDPSTIC
jgi:hypothetical protein